MTSFVVKKENTFRWPVKIPMPVDGGKFTTIKIHVNYLMKDVDYVKGLQERLADLADSDSQVKDVSEIIMEVLDDVLIGWDDGAFQNEDGSPIVFNDDNKEMVLNIPQVRKAVWEEYLNVIGGGQHTRKN